MDPRHRDGLLAAVGLAVLLAGSAATVGPGVLLDPAAAAMGVAGALALEAAFLRYADRLLPLWERRGVPAASLLGLLAVGVAALLYEPRLVGALAWGLATYLLLLACVLAGVWNSPAVVGRGGDE